MRQDQLDGLVAFVAVAEEQGFSAAAVRLGVSPSAVSQSIRNLESKLGLPLFNRTTRSVSLTEVGQRYLERVLPAVRELSAATEELGSEGDTPRGFLRLNVPRAGYMIVLQPILQAFMEQYPKINMEMAIENSLVDIVGRGFDAGIRFGDLVEKDMIGVKIGPPLSAHIVASADYVAKHGIPQKPLDLLAHSCIGFRHTTTGQIERWTFTEKGAEFELAVTGRLIVNDSAVLVQAALDGIGIAYMINGYIEHFVASGRLVRVLTDWSPAFPGLTLYYPDRRRVPLKLRALIDFLRKDRMRTVPNVESILR